MGHSQTASSRTVLIAHADVTIIGASAGSKVWVGLVFGTVITPDTSLDLVGDVVRVVLVGVAVGTRQGACHVLRLRIGPDAAYLVPVGSVGTDSDMATASSHTLMIRVGRAIV
jgi:hypothetical protein